MTAPQLLIFAILVLTMALFAWGRLRHDVVALAALMACILAGLVDPETAFAGFGHPAVITVACVLVLSQGLQNTGAVDALARAVLPRQAGRTLSLFALIGLGAAISGFMNNVGAMALLMPVAMQLSGRLGLTPGQVLMPLAFSTVLGGVTTLVGTPPNLIVSGFRVEAGLEPYAMFDFAPVGVPVALAGVAFIAFLGWRLVAVRRPAASGSFETGTYLTEVRVPEKSKAVNLTVRGFERAIESSDAQIVALVRAGKREVAPHGARRIKADDILVLEAEVGALAEALLVFGIKLEEQVSPAAQAKKAEETTEKPAKAGGAATKAEKAAVTAREQAAADDPAADTDVVLRELVVLPGSTLVGLSASDLLLRTRYRLNLLAVSREGRPPRARLRTLRLMAGDLLLMQGPDEAIAGFIKDTRCVPLGERELRIPDARMAIVSGALLVGAVAIVTLGLMPAAAAFTLAVIASMVVGTVPPRQVYTVIDWPVIVLLAALMPVAEAMEATGAAGVLATFLVDTVAQGNGVAALAVILVTTMFLSDVMNNAATAAVMCPIAIGIASALGASPDSFLMAVAIGASCSFLTPIGHQNNTLILGPGGFRFGDYWKLGLPVEAVVVAVAMPLLLFFWPL